MKPEPNRTWVEPKLSKRTRKAKCDRCTAVVGLYEWAPGAWRCPPCIWIERGKLLKALQKISEGRGQFSQDHFTHAKNAIEDMKAIANGAITKATEG